MKHLALLACLMCAACGSTPPVAATPPAVSLFPGETPQMRALVVKYATIHDIPEDLLHAVIQRESDYRATARNGPY